MKHVILCADDYGQNQVISQAILELVKKKRLSAVSCLTNSYYWLTHAKWLDAFKNEIDRGLHFNLTEGKPLSKKIEKFYSLEQLIIRSHANKLDQNAIEAEFDAQLAQFVAGTGDWPDYIDGHHHIQQLPIIRNAIINVYEKKLRHSHCYIRALTNLNAKYFKSGFFKMLLLQMLGAEKFTQELEEHNIPHNSSFSGIYNFKDAKNYATIFPQFLESIGDRGIIMCHPGLPSISDNEVTDEFRIQEYQFLQSDLFLEICAKHNISLARFNQ